ncbi:MAG: CaiB/BaiF CoA transferase family protein [Syntrophomonadaceae bacterium]|jgi:CoA:oxalate CoA-transferase|nr:CoA transferase [Bacillota bacterium]NLP25213.1 CoA transferase [Syntrophomonadaceae bacterium]
MKALEGVKVLDLTQAYSGPFCTMHLADHGAEVIKLERPGMGDQSRTWGPIVNDYSGYYTNLNRNKKGITLDLRSQAGKEIFLDLVEKVDVVCENFKVGTMERLGLGYEVLKQRNPKLIYASISGFGLTGPLSKLPAYDIVAQAMSGLMSVTGLPENPPTKVGPSVGDNYTGTYLALGVCMALFHRERTGEGQRLDVAMVDTLFSILENYVVEYTIAGNVPTRTGNADPGIAPFDSFTTKDGMIVMGVGTNAMWAKLCDLMGRPDLVDDPRFVTNDDRCKNYFPDLKDTVENYTRSLTSKELEVIMHEAGIPFGYINTVAETANHPQTQHREMLVEVDDPVLGRIKIQGVPIKLHSTPGSVEHSAPTLGQHTEEILASLGKTKDEIEALKEAALSS